MELLRRLVRERTLRTHANLERRNARNVGPSGIQNLRRRPMKLRYLLSGAAGAALLMGGVAVQPAAAAPTSGHQAWCLKAPSMGKTACRYKTLAQCEKYEKAGNGQCVRNPSLAKRKTPTTSGMKTK
jgi:Protein of unknown function (DUF3551)